MTILRSVARYLPKHELGQKSIFMWTKMRAARLRNLFPGPSLALDDAKDGILNGSRVQKYPALPEDAQDCYSDYPRFQDDIQQFVSYYLPFVT